MKRWKISIVVFAAFIGAAHGQAVRPSLGPGAEPKMKPHDLAVTEQLGSQTPIPRDSIRLNNISNKDLDIAYWNGEGAWKMLTVRSLATLDVPCSKCEDFVVLSFPSGRQRNPLKATTGVVYTLYWSTAMQAWDMYSAAGRPVEIGP